jgi:hypothetical protein
MSQPFPEDDAPVDLTARADESPRDLLRSIWSDPERRRLALGGVIVVLVVIVLLLTRGGEPPTPFDQTPTPDDLSARPVTISVSGREYQIVPVQVSDSRWRPASADADSAEWVYGTVVNYVIGLYPTEETVELVEGLEDNAPITLAMSNGSNLHFRMSGRQRVPTEAVAELFRQLRPGITLVVLGEGGDERLVIIGQYDADQEPVTIGEAGLVRVGSPAQLGPWRIMVLSGQLAPDTANPAQAFYYVTFTVEYLGQEPTSADTFDVRLIDGVRVEYIIDRGVSSQGAYAPPGGLVAPRNPTSFTAGYRVPPDLPGPSLVWVFKPSPDSEQSVRFEVPIVRPTPTPAPNTQITAQINSASLNFDQTQLVISGGVGNPTDQPVTITQVDVSLGTPDSVFADLRTADPPFPWVLGPGQTMGFRLEFTRPPGFTAILRIVTLQFEISAVQ